MKFIVATITIVVFLFLYRPATAQGVFKSISNGNWSQTGTWSLQSGTDLDGIPDANDDVTTTNNININGGTAAVHNLTVNNGLLTISTAGFTFPVNGKLTLAGGELASSSATAGYHMLGDILVPTGASTLVDNINFNQDATGLLNIKGTFTSLGNGSGVTKSVGNVIIDAGGKLYFDIGPGGVISTKNFAIYDGAQIDASATGYTLNINGNYNVIQGATGAVTLIGSNAAPAIKVSGATYINGYLTWGSNAIGLQTFGSIQVSKVGSFDNGYGYSMVINGDIKNDGVWYAPTSTTATGSYTVNVAGNYTYSGVSPINMGQLKVTVAGVNVTNNGLLVLSGTTGLSVSAGSFVNGATGYLKILSPATGISNTAGTIDFTQASNKVEYGYAGNQNIFPTNYYNLVGSGGGKKAIVGVTNFSNQLSVSGTTLVDAGTNTLGGTGSLVMTDASTLSLAKNIMVPEFTGSAGSLDLTTTIRLYGNGSQTLRASSVVNYANVLINGASGCTVNMSNVTNVQGDLTISGAATITNNTALTVGGTTTISTTAGVILANSLTTGSFNQTSGSGAFNYSGRAITITGNNGSWSANGTQTTNSVSSLTFTGGVGQTASGNLTLNNLIVNNPGGVTLNSSATVSGTLVLTQGTLVTGSNFVAATAACVITRGSGYVDGNLRRTINACTVGCPALTFDVGSGATYSPMKLTVSSAPSGATITLSVIPGDNSQINSSFIDPAKSVNRTWTINSTQSISLTAQASYPATDVDAAATPSSFFSSLLDKTTFLWTTPLSAATSSSTGYTASATNALLGRTYQFQIGELDALNKTGTIWNILTGNVNWSSQATWIQYRTGKVSIPNGSKIITGTGTLFTSEIQAGNVILLQGAANAGLILGTVASVDSDTQITLTANYSGASIVTPANFGRQKVPDALDAVHIGNALLPAAPVTVTLDINASVFSLDIVGVSQGVILQHGPGNTLSVRGSVSVTQPTAVGRVNAWMVNDGIASIGGTLNMGTATTTASFDKLILTTGTINVAGNIQILTNGAGGYEQYTVLDLSGGNGRINLGGLFIAPNSRGTLISGTTSSINFNSNYTNQTLFFPPSSPNTWVYNNVLCNNSSGGVYLTLSLTPITQSNVTGDIRVQSGTANGDDISTNDNTKTFQVAPGATFTTLGDLPSGYGIYDLGTTSPFGTVVIAGPNPMTFPCLNFGNLIIGGAYCSIDVGTATVAGDLTVSNGGTLTNVSTGTSMTVNGNMIITNGSTMTASYITPLLVGGNVVNNGILTTNGGLLSLTGLVSPQTISGPGTFNFYDLQINTATAAGIVQLQADAIVSDVLTLTNGGLDLNGNTLNVTNNAANAIVRTSPSYIRSEKSTAPYGTVTWSINTAAASYVFPFGKSSTEYVPFTFTITTPPSGFTNAMSVATYGTAPDNLPLPAGVTNLYAAGGVDNSANVVDRFWMITPAFTPTLPTATMKFTATPSEVGSVSGLFAQEWSTGTYWERQSTGQTNSAFSVTVPNVNHFANWALAGNNSALPVTMSAFAGVMKNNLVELSWTTQSESGIDHFGIERSSDGKTFEDVLEAKSKGSVDGSTKYLMDDIQPISGRSYYRLKQVDQNGGAVYFDKVVTVEGQVQVAFNIYPNPVVGNSVTILLPESSTDAEITLRDVFGIQVSSRKAEVSETETKRIELMLDNLREGLYVVSITCNNKVYNSKLIVKTSH